MWWIFSPPCRFPLRSVGRCLFINRTVWLSWEALSTIPYLKNPVEGQWLVQGSMRGRQHPWESNAPHIWRTSGPCHRTSPRYQWTAILCVRSSCWRQVSPLSLIFPNVSLSLHNSSLLPLCLSNFPRTKTHHRVYPSFAIQASTLLHHVFQLKADKPELCSACLTNRMAYQSNSFDCRQLLKPYPKKECQGSAKEKRGEERKLESGMEERWGWLHWDDDNDVDIVQMIMMAMMIMMVRMIGGGRDRG